MEFKERLKQLRLEKGMSQAELGDICGLSDSVIRLYEAGKMEVSLELLTKFADFFDVSTDFLLGKILPDVDAEDAISSYRVFQELSVIRGIKPAKTEKEKIIKSKKKKGETVLSSETSFMVPVYGKIPAGNFLYANQYIENNWPVDSSVTAIYGNDLNQYFYFRNQDSLMEPTIPNKAIVLVQKISKIENGDIVGLISFKGKDATIRRCKSKGNNITLYTKNQTFPPKTYNSTDCNVIGKVIGQMKPINS